MKTLFVSICGLQFDCRARMIYLIVLLTCLNCNLKAQQSEIITIYSVQSAAVSQDRETKKITPDTVAPGSYASIYGKNFPTATKPDIFVDNKECTVHFYSAGQINFTIPDNVSLSINSDDKKSVELRTKTGNATYKLVVSKLAPSFFPVYLILTDSDGVRWPLGEIPDFQLLKINKVTNEIQYTNMVDKLTSTLLPIELIDSEQYRYEAVFYGTGIRGDSKNKNVKFVINNLTKNVGYADKTGDFTLAKNGIDQVNVSLDYETFKNLTGAVKIALYVDGVSSPTYTVYFKSSARASLTVDTPNVLIEPGKTITIRGTGFSSKISNNRVRIGGVQATVVNSNPNEMQITVPYGVKSGRITVARGAIDDNGVFTIEAEAFTDKIVNAQTSISGSITNNQENKDVKGVTIYAKRVNGGNEIETKTDELGRFLFVIPDEPSCFIDSTLKTLKPACEDWIAYINKNAVPSKVIIEHGQDTRLKSALKYVRITSGVSTPNKLAHLSSVNIELNEPQTCGPNAKEILVKSEEYRDDTLQRGIILKIPAGSTWIVPKGEKCTFDISLLKSGDFSSPEFNLPRRASSEQIAELKLFKASIDPGAFISFKNIEAKPVGTFYDLFIYVENQDGTWEWVRKIKGAKVSENGNWIESLEPDIKILTYAFVIPTPVNDTGATLSEEYSNGAMVIGNIKVESEVSSNVYMSLQGRHITFDNNGNILENDIYKSADRFKGTVRYSATANIGSSVVAQIGSAKEKNDTPNLVELGQLNLKRIQQSFEIVWGAPTLNKNEFKAELNKATEIRYKLKDNNQNIIPDPIILHEHNYEIKQVTNTDNCTIVQGTRRITADGEVVFELMCTQAGKYEMTIKVDQKSGQTGQVEYSRQWVYYIVVENGFPAKVVPELTPVCDLNHPSGPAVVLSWQSPDDVQRYEVYRDDRLLNTFLSDKTTVQTYTDKGDFNESSKIYSNLQTGKEYKYKVVAINDKGSTPSDDKGIRLVRETEICKGKPVTVKLGNIDNKGIGNLTNIPVFIGDLSDWRYLNEGAHAYEFELIYDATVFQFNKIISDGTLSQPVTVKANAVDIPGNVNVKKLKVAAFSINAISGPNRVLVYLQFVIKSNIDGKIIKIDKLNLNEDTKNYSGS